MSRAEAIALAQRIASDFARAELMLPLMRGEEHPNGMIPWIDLFDVRTQQHVGRIYNEAEYDALLEAAREIVARALAVSLN